MARLYANENFPLPVVEALRALGHDVLTVQESGEAEKALPDEEVLAFAVAQARAVLTLNRKHFVRLHERPHPLHEREQPPSVAFSRSTDPLHTLAAVSVVAPDRLPRVAA